jgi:hypothetical protein
MHNSTFSLGQGLRPYVNSCDTLGLYLLTLKTSIQSLHIYKYADLIYNGVRWCPFLSLYNLSLVVSLLSMQGMVGSGFYPHTSVCKCVE